MIIELYKDSLISVLENNNRIDGNVFTKAFMEINHAIDEAIITDKPVDELNELKNYITQLKYDILMKYDKC